MSSQRYALHAEERKQQHRLMLQRFEHNRKEAPPPPPPTRLERALEKERTMVLPPKQRTKCVLHSDNGVAIATLCSAVWPSLRISPAYAHVLHTRDLDRVMKMKPVEAACNPSMRTYSSFAQAAKKVRVRLGLFVCRDTTRSHTHVTTSQRRHRSSVHLLGLTCDSAVNGVCTETQAQESCEPAPGQEGA